MTIVVNLVYTYLTRGIEDSVTSRERRIRWRNIFTIPVTTPHCVMCQVFRDYAPSLRWQEYEVQHSQQLLQQQQQKAVVAAVAAAAGEAVVEAVLAATFTVTTAK